MILSGIFGKAAGEITEIYKKKEEIKQIRAQGKVEAEQQKIKLDLEKERARKKIQICKLEAKSRQIETTTKSDNAYDLAVLKASEKTLKDDILVYTILFIVLLHFLEPFIILFNPDFVGINFNIAWDALAKAPRFFEFAMYGILIHSLGLKDVFRMFTTGAIDKLKKKR
jgi:uncharacterized ion transporter superfamily protein YfcC